MLFHHIECRELISNDPINTKPDLTLITQEGPDGENMP